MMEKNNHYEELLDKLRKELASGNNTDLDFLDRLPASKPTEIPFPYGSSSPTPYGWFLRDKNI